MINIGNNNGRVTFTEVTSSTSYGSDVLSDGILEVWNDPATLTDWTVETIGTVNTTQPTFEQTTDCYSGTYAVKLTGAADETASKCFYQNAHTLAAGDYILEGYIKNSGLGNGHLLFWNNLRGFATEIWNFATQAWEAYTEDSEDSNNMYALNPGTTYAKFTSPVISLPASGNICPGLMGDYGNESGNSIYFDELTLKTVATTGTSEEIMSLGDGLLDFENNLTIGAKTGSNASLTLTPDGTGTTTINSITSLNGKTAGMALNNASYLRGIKNGMSIFVEARGYADDNGGSIAIFAGDAGTAGGARNGGIVNLYGGSQANGGGVGYVQIGSLSTSPACLALDNDGDLLVTGSLEVFNIAFFTDIRLAGQFIHNELVKNTASTILNDDGYLDLPNSKSGWGEIFVGDNEEYVKFRFTTAGVITLMDSTANIDSADTDGKFCVFDNGSNVRIKNRLGAIKTFKYIINY